MVQLWVNLPAVAKKTEAKYQAIQNEDISRFKLNDGLGEIEVIAGNYNGIAGSASTFTPIHMYNLKAKSGAEVTFDFPEHYNTMLLVLEGSITINNNENVPTDHLALMEKVGEIFTVKVTDDAIVLVLSGEPINEPIAHYGPFVMNTQQELMEAVNDFNAGKFGKLED